MINRFLGVWIVYWLMIFLMPVRSIYPATLEAFLLQVIFVILVTLSYSITMAAWRFPSMPDAGTYQLPSTLFIIRTALLMSLAGFLLLIYDKVFIQGINFSEGFAVAREAWREIGAEREGKASSIFSALGYLLGSAYFVAVVIVITQSRFMTSREIIGTLFISFIFLIGNSVITGGRSNVLLLATFVLASFFSRKGFRLKDLFRSKFQLNVGLIGVATAIVYILIIFYQRAAAGGMDAVDYVLDFLPFLGIEVADWYQQILDEGIFSSLSALFVLTITYVTHSFATVAAIINGPIEDKTIVFLHASDIFYKIGLADAPEGDWFLAGRMPSVPGALWHQFSLIGFLVCTLSIGIISAAAKIWAALRPTYLLPLGAYVAAESTLLLTPILFAPDFLSFPFIIAGFVILALIQYLFRPKRNCSEFAVSA